MESNVCFPRQVVIYTYDEILRFQRVGSRNPVELAPHDLVYMSSITAAPYVQFYFTQEHNRLWFDQCKVSARGIFHRSSLPVIAGCCNQSRRFCNAA